jgi:hypothetical protein
MRITIQAPSIVQDYSSHTGGVNKVDMFQYLFDHNKRSNKWRHRLLFAVTDMALVNSPRSYSELHGKILFLDFK